MRSTSGVVAAAILAAAACGPGGDPADDGPDDSPGSCPGVCARYDDCFGAGSRPDCALDCEASVERGDLTPDCLTCEQQLSCAELGWKVGLAKACGNPCSGPGEICPGDDNCRRGELCDFAEGECQRPCTRDGECDFYEGCCPDGEVASCSDVCASPCSVGEALSAADGRCHPTCAGVAECYPGYCADDSLCRSTEAFQQCQRVAEQQRMDASAPLLFSPRQDPIGVGGELCVKAETCAGNGNVCQFSFQFYDPDGDVPQTLSALYSSIREIDRAGLVVAPYDVREANGTTLTVHGCFDEASTALVHAVVLWDEAGNRSNPLCFEGSAP